MPSSKPSWEPFDGFQLMNCTPAELKKVDRLQVLFLLPYCLKPLDCAYRKKNFCNKKCNRDCVYGKLTSFLDSKRFFYVQITSFAHLEETISKYKTKFRIFAGLTCNPLPYTGVLNGLKCINFLIQGHTCFSVSEDLSRIVPNKEMFKKAKGGDFDKEATLNFENFVKTFHKVFYG